MDKLQQRTILHQVSRVNVGIWLPVGKPEQTCAPAYAELKKTPTKTGAMTIEVPHSDIWSPKKTKKLREKVTRGEKTRRLNLSRVS